MKLQELALKWFAITENAASAASSFASEGTRGVLINDGMLFQVVLTSELLDKRTRYPICQREPALYKHQKIKRTMLERLKLQEVCCQDSKPVSDSIGRTDRHVALYKDLSTLLRKALQ